MRILLTNDDGLRAPGIRAMYEALADVDRTFGRPLHGSEPDNIFVVAPETVQSATSHGLTFHQPMLARPQAVTPYMNGVSVDGRPADCVKLAIHSLWPEEFGKDSAPELVISGMNAGANCGVNVLYSGTVAAASEATILGIPSIAVSLHLGSGKPRFDVAARHARQVIERVLEAGLTTDECLNINVPVTEDDGPLPPVRVCPMSPHAHVDDYDQRRNPSGEMYFWAAGNGLNFRQTPEGSDVNALFQGMITVTPLKIDRSDYEGVARWHSRLDATPE